MRDTRTYTSVEAMKLGEISYRQIDYWRRSGLVTPSVHIATGTGDPCLWSLDDIVQIAVVKALLDAGVSLQRARGVIEQLRAMEEVDVVLIDSDGTAFPAQWVEVAQYLTMVKSVTFVRVSAVRDEVEKRASDPSQPYAAA